jgi:hypothetical protein
MRWRESLNTRCVSVKSPANLQSNHAHPNKCVSTASRPLWTTPAEHWKLNGRASVDSVKPSVNAGLSNAWPRWARTTPWSSRVPSSTAYRTVFSGGTVGIARSCGHLKKRVVQVFERWKKFQTASAIIIRRSGVRVPDAPPNSTRKAAFESLCGFFIVDGPESPLVALAVNTVDRYY